MQIDVHYGFSHDSRICKNGITVLYIRNFLSLKMYMALVNKKYTGLKLHVKYFQAKS